MSRYGDIATLEAVAVSIGEEGEAIETVTSQQVFVNPYRVGASMWLAAMSAGLHADAQIELRTCDYDGQQRIVMRGVRYDIERVNDMGEFTRLTLSRRLDSD